MTLDQNYTTWNGKREIKVSWYNSGLKSNNGRPWPAEACVTRTFTPSDALYLRLFEVDKGIVYRPGMQQGERNKWMHLYDGVCCESISPSEAYECIEAGYVFENLLVRASNYMHLV